MNGMKVEFKKQCFSLSEIAIEISDIFVKRNKNELKLEKKNIKIRLESTNTHHLRRKFEQFTIHNRNKSAENGLDWKRREMNL